MNFRFNEIKWDTANKIAEKEVAVRTSVSEMESGGATKVLDVLADARIVSLDATGNSARVFGRVNFKLLYLNNDGEIRGLDYFADFSETVQTENLNGKLYGQIAVIDTDTSIGGGIKLNAVVKITLFSVCSDMKKCLVGADDDVYVENKKMRCQRFCTSINTSFTVSDDYDTKTDVMKILLTRADAYVEKATAGMGNVLLTGAVNATVTYLAGDKLTVTDFHIPYSEEFQADGVEIGQKLEADVTVKNVRVVLTGVEGANVIRIEAEVEANVKAYDVAEEEVVKDVFSITHELNEKRAVASGGIHRGFEFYKDDVSGIAALTENMPSALEVIGVTHSENNVARAYSESGKIVIEGVFGATVLYRDENGVSSVNLEVPYSLPFMNEGSDESDTVTANGVVLYVSSKLKREKEIEVNATLGFMTGSIGTCSAEYIEEIEEGREKEVNKSAVSVFVAEEGDTIWDASKALSARPDDIMAQNPELTTPFREGQKVFYYREISFEF